MVNTATELDNFAVVLDSPNEQAWNNVRDLWPESHFIHTDRIAYLRLPTSTLTSSISSQVGMNRERKVRGVVLRVDSYYGWNDRGLWEWLNFANE
jgi:hypothetical protein